MEYEFKNVPWLRPGQVVRRFQEVTHSEKRLTRPESTLQRAKEIKREKKEIRKKKKAKEEAELVKKLEKKEMSEQDNVRDRSKNGRSKSRSRSRGRKRKYSDRSADRSSPHSHIKLQRIKRNLRFVTERFSRVGSENNHAKLCFNSFFLYSAERRPKLSASLGESEKFDRILEEWVSLDQRGKTEVMTRVRQEESLSIDALEEFSNWVDTMHNTDHQVKHDDILRYISSQLNRKKVWYVDIEGHRTKKGGTVPNFILNTEKRPDIVVVENHKKILTVFELVVPFHNEEGRRMKEEKYKDLFTNMTYEVQYRPFAVGSVTGFLDDIDKDAIKTLHQFCKKDIELDQFLCGIQSTASFEFNKLLDMILETREEKKRRWMKEWSARRW